MKTVINYFKRETVLTIALIAAVISMFFVRPSVSYFSYINYSVLALLFCLMMVVAGLMRANLFAVLLARLLGITNSSRKIILIFVTLSFFGAMLVTNDVMLLTIVPVTIGLFGRKYSRQLIFSVVMETIAANLGSMLTPIGNPQNLYLYSYYQMEILEFLKLVFPIGLLSYVLLVLTVLFSKEEILEAENKEVEDNPKDELKKRQMLLYLFLFVLAIGSVLRFIDYRLCLSVTVVLVAFFDRSLFRKVDYALLLTFAAFFIFVGNLAEISVIRNAIAGAVTGHEFMFGLLLSQVISNVPAAVMLSGFVTEAKGLLLGVDVGGVGTLVASLASLISYKLYVASEQAEKGRYMLVFTIWNVVYLIVLTGVTVLTGM